MEARLRGQVLAERCGPPFLFDRLDFNFTHLEKLTEAMIKSDTMAMVMRFTKGLTDEKTDEFLTMLPLLDPKDAPRSRHFLEKARTYSRQTLEESVWTLPERPHKRKKGKRKSTKLCPLLRLWSLWCALPFVAF